MSELIFKNLYKGQGDMSDAELIKYLKQEVRRVKMQRNEYEEELKIANRELNRVKTELKLLETYINRKRKP